MERIIGQKQTKYVIGSINTEHPNYAVLFPTWEEARHCIKRIMEVTSSTESEIWAIYTVDVTVTGKISEFATEYPDTDRMEETDETAGV